MLLNNKTRKNLQQNNVNSVFPLLVFPRNNFPNHIKKSSTNALCVANQTDDE